MTRYTIHQRIVRYLKDNPGWNKIGSICKQLNIEPHSFGRYAYALDEVERYEDPHKEVYYRYNGEILLEQDNRDSSQ